ncbi:hypothetical protein [Methylomonas methanica]|uniref:Outer membrane protein assembly factor BamC n=1 Tax=Methylomonas methanica (strain DSM 25384 / MC09) TaxID=857087 RepID=G0A345_METMM|nr:hypothetical protein [Methylomonas methanica]AEF98977.1 hypothetical protein Metme_0533 [Methylomonas methanica MC09]
MSKRLIIGLPVLLLAACADTSDRYRDTHHLELPPELPIEHTHTQPAVAADDLSPQAARTSPLENLVDFKDDGEKPLLTLKTRPDRAWEMVVVALKISNIEVLDKNREENRIQVRYDPDTNGREPRVLDVFFNDDYAETDYTIRLKEDVLGIAVNVALSKPEQLEYGEDGSPNLLRLLHKTIDEKIIHRERNQSEE